MSNKPLLASIGLIVALHLIVVYAQPLHALFGTQGLAAGQLAVTLVVGSIVLWAVEIEKWLKRRRG